MSVPTDPRPPRVAGVEEALEETRLSGAQVYSGTLLDLRSDRVRLPDGGESVREYVVHPGAVLIIPVLDDGRLVVERQFRYPHNRSFLEFPAGKLDPGETALLTARRELVEETGYTAVQWTRLGVVHPVISYSTEAIDLYMADALTQVGARPDHGEFLELLQFTTDGLCAALDEGRVTDAKTIAALMLFTRWQAATTRACRLRIIGAVQGVGFRDWMVGAAQDAGVAGWVRNRGDGSVEARLQGPREPCDRLIASCRRGPPSAQVTLLEVSRAAPDAALGRFDCLPSA